MKRRAVILPVLLILAACEGPTGPEGPQGAQGPQGPAGAALQVQVNEGTIVNSELHGWKSGFCFDPSQSFRRRTDRPLSGSREPERSLHYSEFFFGNLGRFGERIFRPGNQWVVCIDP